MNNFDYTDKFEQRHIGPSSQNINDMIKSIDCNSLDELIDKTIPAKIRNKKKLNVGSAITETQFLDYIKNLSSKNKVAKSFIGMGYNPAIMPPVIQRNILENPGWYTQYTPYQAEISQGRLEALLNFQTMICDLTALPISNASLLDEATAAAEAMLMLHAYSVSKGKSRNKFFIDVDCFHQTIDVLKTRADSKNIELVIGNFKTIVLNEDYFGVLVQYPNDNGEIDNFRDFFSQAASIGVRTVVAADLLSLTLLIPPGEFGADVCVGSTQRFGLPMGFGGPHSAFFSVKDEFKRIIPGRIIGVSIDAQGNTAYRMALQTREQHIKREKATSNICTAQVLLAILSSMYAVYHGPSGLKNIAERIYRLTSLLKLCFSKLDFEQKNINYFDTLKVNVKDSSLKEKIKSFAEKQLINFRYFEDNTIGISINETTSVEDILGIISIFAKSINVNFSKENFEQAKNNSNLNSSNEFLRTSKFLEHKIFNSFHSETELLRYCKRLENKDLSLTTSMIPLGSCTMKLNAASEMLSITLPEISNIHPFAPEYQVKGYKKIISELEKSLLNITGFDGISLQPNSGAQGEYAGLMVIKQYLNENGNGDRDIVLIPSSAHGTNPASAVMAGMQVVVINCKDNGDIDIDDLKSKAELNKAKLAALMITYPSTFGVYQNDVKLICKIIHENGGQVYMDGANMNAQVGLTSPKIIGADVCHLNLHKTFAIPHGGGGPGIGPICVAKHLTPYLPSHCFVKVGGDKAISAVSAAPFGSAGILLISLGYIKMLGDDGLTNASKIAILNANYIKSRLEKYFKVLYSGEYGYVAHELIFDMREFKNTASIEVEDIAKRLIDYGFHSPTVSFPVAGTLMVEPTESESKEELDRFCDAIISIRNEIKEIELGEFDKTDNVLKNAPHTYQMAASDSWNHSYTREKAAFPNKWVLKNKFWPSVARVNNAYGDRNLVCSCNPIEDYLN